MVYMFNVMKCVFNTNTGIAIDNVIWPDSCGLTVVVI